MIGDKLPLEHPPRQAAAIYAHRLAGLCLIALLSATPLAYALLLYRLPQFTLVATIVLAGLAGWKKRRLITYFLR